jgi:hypothetical protein
MIPDLSALWRQISEYLPPWARVTFFASAAIGEGFRQLANLLHPPFDYASVSYWGWTIFGMFVAYPSVFLWRTIGRKLLNIRDPFEAAREYIQVIKLAMHEAQLSRTEQLFQWRSVFQKLRDELHIGARPQPLTQAELAAMVRAEGGTTIFEQVSIVQDDIQTKPGQSA